MFCIVNLRRSLRVYMGLEHGDKFFNIVAQAPSYSNREILNESVARIKRNKNAEGAEDFSNRIQLSCGRFDSMEHAQNQNLAHTKELAQILGGLPIHTGDYGHLIHCWSRELTVTLPILYKKQNELEQKNESKASKLSSFPQSSSFSRAPEHPLAHSFFGKRRATSLPDFKTNDVVEDGKSKSE